VVNGEAGRGKVEGLGAFVAWVVDKALPVWSVAGFDPVAGRFRERLDWSGAPLDVPHRAMVQARQIYVYSRACEVGWLPEGGALAETAMASLIRDFGEISSGEASFAFAVDAAGNVVDDTRDAYAHAFVLYGIAWLYRLNGDPALLGLADKLRAFISSRLVDARHGGVFDAVPPASREKRQNPLMHLLEAYLALERAAPGRGALEDAAALVHLFDSRLYDDESGVLREYFARDWAPSADPARADLWEPGHHFEWVWLLREYERLSGDDRGMHAAGRLYQVAREHGLGDDGLVHDVLASDRAVRASSHRVWPHAEAIKAAMARHAGGDPDALAFGRAMARRLLVHFLDMPFEGGWIDHIDSRRRPLVTYVPASSLYHLVFAAAEAARAVPEAGLLLAAGAGPQVLQ
jgi:mannose/cellobiose epimerase-like protein (N-acyl-D-glucosamine 2-epimerase family)